MKKYLILLPVIALIMSACTADGTLPSTTVSPGSLSFGADENIPKTLIVTSTTTWTVAVAAADQGWLHAYVSGNVITVTANNYDGEEPRTGTVIITPAEGNPVNVTVTQKEKDALDISGTWKVTGTIWDMSLNFVNYTGTLTIAYDDALGGYYASPLPDRVSGLEAPDGGMLLDVKGQSVYFKQGKKLDKVYNFMVYDFTYTNCIVMSPNGTFKEGHWNVSYPIGDSVKLEVGNDGKTITFPATVSYEGNDVAAAFGFGFYDDSGASGPAGALLGGAGVLKEMVLTKQ